MSLTRIALISTLCMPVARALQVPVTPESGLPQGVIRETNGTVTMMKRVLPRERPETSLTVPRIVWQTWKDDGRSDPNSLEVIQDRAKVMLKWIAMNPTWEYRLLDDEDGEQYIRTHFSEEHAAAWRGLAVGASKADILRYFVMYHDGGVYADTDSAPGRQPLDSWIDPRATGVFSLDNYGELEQWGLIGAPNNCMYKNAIDTFMDKVRRNRVNHKAGTSSYYNVMSLDPHGREKDGEAYVLHVSDKPRRWGGIVGFTGPAAMSQGMQACMASALQGAYFCPGKWYGFRLMMKDHGGMSTWHRYGVPAPCRPVVIRRAGNSSTH